MLFPSHHIFWKVCYLQYSPFLPIFPHTGWAANLRWSFLNLGQVCRRPSVPQDMPWVFKDWPVWVRCCVCKVRLLVRWSGCVGFFTTFLATHRGKVPFHFKAQPNCLSGPSKNWIKYSFNVSVIHIFPVPCKTVGDRGLPCVFPFIYENTTYNSCTPRDSDNGQPWYWTYCKKYILCLLPKS